MKRIGLILLLLAPLALGKEPNPSITLTVSPENATTGSFDVRAELNPDGASVQWFFVEVKFEGRSGREYTWRINGPVTKVVDRWIINATGWKPPAIQQRYPDIDSALDAIKYRSYPPIVQGTFHPGSTGFAHGRQ